MFILKCCPRHNSCNDISMSREFVTSFTLTTFAKMYHTVNEEDLSVQEFTAWTGCYSNTSVILGSYSSISYFIFQVLFVSIFELSYHLETFVKDLFTSILFNMSCYGNNVFLLIFRLWRDSGCISSKQRGKKNVHLFVFLQTCHYKTTKRLAWRIKRAWAVPFSS